MEKQLFHRFVRSPVHAIQLGIKHIYDSAKLLLNYFRNIAVVMELGHLVKANHCFSQAKGVQSMCFHERQKAMQGMSSIVALITTALSILLFLPVAEGSVPVNVEIPMGYKQFHVQYDVKADGTYNETYQLALTVLTEQGVLQSQQKPVGMPHSFIQAIQTSQKRDVEVLSAYTLKKNGNHIEAIPSNPRNGNGSPASGVMPIPPNLRAQIKFIAFQKVEIGDTLVFSYKVIRNKPDFPNNIVIEQSFPKFMEYDDVTIRLNAPASLHLRIDSVGIENGKNAGDDQTQKWVWTYQNPKPEVFQPNQPPSINFKRMPRIHISSFKDQASEAEAISKLSSTFPHPLNNSAEPFSPPFPKDKGCMALGDLPNDGPAAMDAFEDRVSLYFWHNGTWLEGVTNAWSDPKCVFDDGRPMLTALDAGYSSNFQQFKGTQKWDLILNRLKHLKAKFPNQAFVAIAEATYWTEYAWDARGDGLASSVTPDGWKLFHERLENAEKVLNDTKYYSSQLPAWYDEMILVQSALDRPAKDRDKTFLEGTKRFKTYYQTYFTMLNFLSPKWGGSWDTVDNLVQWSVANTKEIDGSSMYARLYWSASGGLLPGTSLFKDTRATWPKMKQGFEDLMARHPKSKWNLNNFAKFACMANDKVTFLKLRDQIGRDVVDAAWPPNTSLDLCETKFGYSQ